MSEIFTIMKSEMMLTGIIFLLLLLKLGKGFKNENLLSLIQALLFINVAVSLIYNFEGTAFYNMYQSNALIFFEKSILNLGVFLISLVFGDWFLKSENLTEFFILMLSSVLGMFLLISSGNFLMFFLSLELASIPVAALANFDLHKKISSEAALKLILSSAFSSGILLFGISLLYGATGTISFAELPALINGSPMQILAFVFILSAFAFKLSIVPFNLWTADVYEGSPIAVTAFLSVISKGAVAFIFITVLFKVFQPMQNVWYNMIMLLSIATMLIGNLFAVRQQNIKRFLAFSSIAQVGFILLALTGNSASAVASVVFFVLIYIFSNLAAFGVASVISAQTGKENIDDYKAMYQNNKLLSWVFALALFSLAGIPPTAGFFGKLFLISAGAAKANYAFIIFAALNMIISLYYYLRIVRSIFMDKNESPIEKLNIQSMVKLGLIICAAGVVLAGLISWIYDYIVSLTATM